MLGLAWPDILLSVAVGVSLAAAAGLRVFLPMLALGLAGRSGWMTLGPEFAWLADTPGLVVLAVATVAEIAAYYVPLLDNTLDIIGAPIAAVAGIIAVAAVTTELPPALRWSVAVVAGGGAAGLVQGLTTLTRLKSSGLTGGFANPVLATVEAVGAGGIALVVMAVPAVAVLGLVLSGVLFVRWSRRRRRHAV